MAKTLSRKVTIYIDGKPADASLQQLNDRLLKLTKEKNPCQGNKQKSNTKKHCNKKYFPIQKKVCIFAN